MTMTCNFNRILTTALILLTAAAAGAPAALRADLNGDGVVDLQDLAILTEEWLMTDNLITNGTFDTDTDWLKTNASIADGVASLNASYQEPTASITQIVPIDPARKYRLAFDVIEYASGYKVTAGPATLVTIPGLGAVGITTDSASSPLVIDNFTLRLAGGSAAQLQSSYYQSMNRRRQ